MARKTSKTLTDAEQRIMEALWDRGEASVREIVDDISKENPVAYNTVQTILGILEKKKYVQFRRQGRAYIYAPRVSQTDARREAFSHMLSSFFSGSKNAFAQYLIEVEGIEPSDLEEMRRLVRDADKKRKAKS